MKKIMVFCDESGAKGYSDKQERFKGEVGVFAGVSIPFECANDLNNILDQNISSLKPENSKFHIADLSDLQKEQLREICFKFIKDNNLMSYAHFWCMAA